MNHCLTNLSDESVLRGITASFQQEHHGIAAGLVHIAEAERRKLYRQGAYSSMVAWCVGETPLTKPAALNRIRAARVVRRFPALLEALADGRLHLGAVLLLKPWLTPSNVDEWIRSAARKSKREIQWLIREHSAPTLPSAAPVPVESPQLLPGGVGGSEHPHRPSATAPNLSSGEEPLQLLPGGVTTAPQAEPIESRATDELCRAKWTLRSPGVHELRLLFGQAAFDRVRHLHELLSHQFTEAEQASVIRHAIEVDIRDSEKKRFAATERPRTEKVVPASTSRTIPAAVKRAVWARDAGRCTFVAANGNRCNERKLIQFDHIVPIGRDGKSTVENLRLLCRAHNQLAAERVYGPAFMEAKLSRGWQDEERARAS